MKPPHSRRRSIRRQGSAVVEMAVCLPVLLLLTFGSIQTCDMLFLKHAATAAAYEGTLAVSKSDATTASVTEAALRILQSLGIQHATVSISPGIEVADMPQGTQVTVSVNVPVSANLRGPRLLPAGGSAITNGVTLR